MYNMVHCGLYRLQTTVLSYNIGASEMVVLEFQKAVCPEDFRRRLERDFGCLHNRLLGQNKFSIKSNKEILSQFDEDSSCHYHCQCDSTCLPFAGKIHGLDL